MTVAVLGLTYGPYQLIGEYILNERSLNAPGSVVDVDSIRRQPDTISVRFTTLAGQEVTAEIDGEDHKVGDEVSVDYDPEKPSRARLHGEGGQRDAALMYTGMGLVGGFGFIRATAKARRDS